jgi:hypothetical protein
MMLACVILLMIFLSFWYNANESTLTSFYHVDRVYSSGAAACRCLIGSVERAPQTSSVGTGLGQDYLKCTRSWEAWLPVSLKCTGSASDFISMASPTVLP